MTLADRGWLWLRGNPANRNDRYKLELSKVWEPSDSQRPTPDGEGQASHCGLLYGNKNKVSKNRKNYMFVGFQ